MNLYEFTDRERAHLSKVYREEFDGQPYRLATNGHLVVAVSWGEMPDEYLPEGTRQALLDVLTAETPHAINAEDLYRWASGDGPTHTVNEVEHEPGRIGEHTFDRRLIRHVLKDLPHGEVGLGFQAGALVLRAATWRACVMRMTVDGPWLPRFGLGAAFEDDLRARRAIAAYRQGFAQGADGRPRSRPWGPPETEQDWLAGYDAGLRAVEEGERAYREQLEIRARTKESST